MLIHVSGRRYYETAPEAYGQCPECQMVVDAWRYPDPSHCPGCPTALVPLGSLPSPEEAIRMCLEQCQEDGCFGEGFAYPVPLRPTLLIKHKDGFTDEYGGERRISDA